MSYPPVNIVNSTDYTVSGTVTYMSSSCSDDEFTIGPWSTWEAKSRGVCLLTEIALNTDAGGGHGADQPGGGNTVLGFKNYTRLEHRIVSSRSFSRAPCSR